jgi:hypothetical protein
LRDRKIQNLGGKEFMDWGKNRGSEKNFGHRVSKDQKIYGGTILLNLIM